MYGFSILQVDLEFGVWEGLGSLSILLLERKGPYEGHSRTRKAPTMQKPKAQMAQSHKLVRTLQHPTGPT